MNQPNALAAWSRELDLFPHELVVALSAITNPIDALIGPLRDRHRRGANGEPDGYSDIGRRGAYERLLLSEWLLAMEEPDEWMRRAAAGEHSFLELSRRKPVVERLSVVLFDSGPSQWGSARLAHLAALIVLQRRAKEAGARFGWGILQHEASEKSFWGEVTEASILRLTAGVSARDATAADIAGWRELIARDQVGPTTPADLWLIGGQRLGALVDGANASLLSVREVDEGDDVGGSSGSDSDWRYLIANARFGSENTPRMIAKDVRLPLPSPALSVRLLRDPFGARAHKPAVVSEKKTVEAPRNSPASELLFSLHGSKLYARAAAFGGTTLLVYPIGTSPAANVVSPPKQYRSQFGNPFFAVGRIGKATILATLTTDGSEVRIETFNKTAGVNAGTYRLKSAEKQTTFDFTGKSVNAVDRARLTPIVPLFSADGRQNIDELVTALPDGRLLRLRWNAEKNEGEALVTDLQCLALHRGKNGVSLATSADNRVDRYILHDKPDSHGSKLVFYDSLMASSCPNADESAAIHNARPIAFQDGLEYGDPVAAAYSGNPAQVTVATIDHVVIELPAGHELVGVGRNASGDPFRRPALFLLSPDRTTVSSAFAEIPSELTPLFRTAGAPIIHVAKSPCAPLIAFATADGEVAVWSLNYKDYVYRCLVTATE